MVSAYNSQNDVFVTVQPVNEAAAYLKCIEWNECWALNEINKVAHKPSYSHLHFDHIKMYVALIVVRYDERENQIITTGRIKQQQQQSFISGCLVSAVSYLLTRAVIVSFVWFLFTVFNAPFIAVGARARSTPFTMRTQMQWMKC